MKDGPDIARIAALFGDPARANMLGALMGGQALTAGELAREAGIMPPTASGHLAQLADAGLLACERQGRHRYYRLAGPEIAAAIEALEEVATQIGGRRTRPGPKDPAMRTARVCYDHLAGTRGVQLFQCLCTENLLALSATGVTVTPRGEATLTEFGIDIPSLRRNPRPICRTCLDWSERKPHLAGSLGASLLTRILALGWARRDPASRTIHFTRTGDLAFARLFRA
jgi:DNA-binding transcriptional ArsR family regulator